MGMREKRKQVGYQNKGVSSMHEQKRTGAEFNEIERFVAVYIFAQMRSSL